MFDPDAEDAEKRRLEEEEDNDEDLPDVPDDYNRDDDEDGDEFDDDKLTEESYRTTVDTMPEDLDLEAAEVADDDDDY